MPSSGKSGQRHYPRCPSHCYKHFLELPSLNNSDCLFSRCSSNPSPHPLSETGTMFLISASPVLTWYLTHRLLECWVPRMGLIRAESYHGGGCWKGHLAMVQMGNTDLKARALSREIKEEALMVWDLKETPPALPWFHVYILVSCLPV